MRHAFALALLLSAAPLAARDTVLLNRDWQVRLDPADTAAMVMNGKNAFNDINRMKAR